MVLFVFFSCLSLLTFPARFVQDLWAIENKTFDRMKDRYHNQTRNNHKTMDEWVPTGRSLTAEEKKMKGMTAEVQVTVHKTSNIVYEMSQITYKKSKITYKMSMRYTFNNLQYITGTYQSYTVWQGVPDIAVSRTLQNGQRLRYAALRRCRNRCWGDWVFCQQYTAFCQNSAMFYHHLIVHRFGAFWHT